MSIALVVTILALAAGPSPAGQDIRPDVAVPGGTGFVSSALGMAFTPGTDDPSLFMVHLVSLLEEPGMFMRAVKFERYLEDIDELRKILVDLDRRYGSVEPRLDREGSYSYERAKKVFDFMGVRIRENNGAFSLELRNGGTQERRRLILGHMGFDVESRLQGWEAGELVDLELHDEFVPLEFGAEVWREQVFRKDLDAEEIFREFIEDTRPRQLLLGISRLDDATREHIFRTVGLREIYRDENFLEGFRETSLYLRVEGGQIVLPGRDRQAWEKVLGRWKSDAELLKKFAKEDQGRGARLLRALALVDDDMARYLLTGNGSGEKARRDWANDVYNASPQPSYGNMMRWTWDFPELAINLRMAPAGHVDWPGGTTATLAAVRGDGIIDKASDLSRELRRAADRFQPGRSADLEILKKVLESSNPDDLIAELDRGTLRTQRFLAVAQALRYQPETTTSRAVPLLYRSYPRYGPAYGFVTVPQPLAPATIEGFVFKLHEADKIGEIPGRVEAMRELESMLILLRRMVLNQALPADAIDVVLQSFFALPLVKEPDVLGSTPLGFGPGLFDWWRGSLIPALDRGRAGAGETEPTAQGYVDSFIAAVVGDITPAVLQVGGIDHVYDPAADHRARIERHLEQLRAPPLELLLELDRLAVEVQQGAATERAEDIADELEAALARLLGTVPESVFDRHQEDMLRSPVLRRDLDDRVERLARNLRRSDLGDDDAARVRNAVSSWTGDALSSLVYAVYMGDPNSLFYRDRTLSWGHLFDGFLEDDPGTVYQGFEPTSETTDPERGSILINSLLGVPSVLGRWNLELTMLTRSQAPMVEAVEQAWGSSLASLHLPSLTERAHRHAVDTHAAGLAWLRSAIEQQNPDAVTAEHPDMSLSRALRFLMRPGNCQLAVNAIGRGDEETALRLISIGNRYMLGRMVDVSTDENDAFVRFERDQTIGLNGSRMADYLGLRRPLPVPYGEASHGTSDPAMYARLIDIRLALSLALDELGLPPVLHARLLPLAMADVLASVRPDTQVAWEELLGAIPERVTAVAVTGWVEDLAFAGELRPATGSGGGR